MANIRIYVANLGKYNEGELVGAWLDLPASDEEIQALYDEIQICNDENNYFDSFGCPYEEIAIHDYESEIPGLKIGEYDNINDLNEIAEELENISEEEAEIIGSYLENMGGSFESALKVVKDGDYRIYYDCYDMSDVAYEAINEFGYLENVSDFMKNYFDYEAFGRDLNIEGSYFYIDGGRYVEFF